MDPMIFQFIGQYLDAALNPFITGTVGEVISTFTLFFIGGATIHLTLMLRHRLGVCRTALLHVHENVRQVPVHRCPGAERCNLLGLGRR